MVKRLEKVLPQDAIAESIEKTPQEETRISSAW